MPSHEEKLKARAVRKQVAEQQAMKAQRLMETCLEIPFQAVNHTTYVPLVWMQVGGDENENWHRAFIDISKTKYEPIAFTDMLEEDPFGRQWHIRHWWLTGADELPN